MAEQQAYCDCTGSTGHFHTGNDPDISKYRKLVASSKLLGKQGKRNRNITVVTAPTFLGLVKHENVTAMNSSVASTRYRLCR